MKNFLSALILIVTTQTTFAQVSDRLFYHIPGHENVETAIGYSQGIKVDNVIYISGTVDGLHEDMATQVKTIYGYVQKTLANYGASFDHIVKETVYTVNLEEFKKCIPIRKAFYSDGKYPTSTWVEVKSLFVPSLKVEIEFIAVIDK